MRKVKEILRLRWGLGLGVRQIARSCSVSHSTVSEILARAEVAGLSWPLPEDVDEAALEARLYPAPSQAKGGKAMPDMEHIHKELRKKGVTLQLLWEEYKQAHPDGYQRTQFCQAYRDWAKTIDVVDAAGACGRREDVRGLRGADGPRGRPVHRRDP